jgi:hypothetical protein
MLRAASAAALLALAAACGTPQPCPTPLEQCGGQCVDVASDRLNCGGCGTICAPGNVCVQGGCTGADPLLPCGQRTGGAFVTLGVCGAAVKIWAREEGFVGAAEQRLGAPDPDSVPSLAVAAGTDCDAQWSWHVAATGASFVVEDAIDPGLACSVCPGAIQADVAAGNPARRTWCPASATVLAVDRRPPP